MSITYGKNKKNIWFDMSGTIAIRPLFQKSPNGGCFETWQSRTVLRTANTPKGGGRSYGTAGGVPASSETLVIENSPPRPDEAEILIGRQCEDDRPLASTSRDDCVLTLMSDREVDDVFLRLRWPETNGKPVCPGRVRTSTGRQAASAPILLLVRPSGP